jgi:hypothetical protein
VAPKIHTEIGSPFVIGDSETRTSNPIKLLLDLLDQCQEALFEALDPGDEPWFFSAYLARTTIARSRDQITPVVRSGIGSSKVMVTAFFMGNQMLVLNDLPKGRKFNQDNFLSAIYRRETPIGGCLCKKQLDLSFPFASISSKRDLKAIAI